jgi:hypothetical protein
MSKQPIELSHTMLYFIKRSHLFSIMSKQPIELSLVKIELRRNNTLLCCVTLNSNMCELDMIRVVFKPAVMHFTLEFVHVITTLVSEIYPDPGNLQKG